MHRKDCTHDDDDDEGEEEEEKEEGGEAHSSRQFLQSLVVVGELHRLGLMMRSTTGPCWSSACDELLGCQQLRI